ncbi:MAG: division/cell wall cluster transcriptional repressor MraZ [Rickettsiales bacterium]
MGLFLSSFTKKIDKKGRVSVPSTFRAVLSSEHYQGVVVRHSFINPCIEACGMTRMEQLKDQINSLDPYSEEHEAFSTAILGGSDQLPFDGEGRIILPEELLKDAGITEEAVFVGKGDMFEIWEPKAYAKYAEHARKVALENRAKLRARNGVPS